MFIRKSKISHLIKKERSKERSMCETKAAKELKKALANLEKKYSLEIKNISKDHKTEILNKNKEIVKLKSEINKHYTKYQEIRRRETELEMLTADFEDTLGAMGIKIHESIQPFFRNRAKIESAKRKSDKKHEKVQSIFRAAK